MRLRRIDTINDNCAVKNHIRESQRYVREYCDSGASTWNKSSKIIGCYELMFMSVVCNPNPLGSTIRLRHMHHRRYVQFLRMTLSSRFVTKRARYTHPRSPGLRSLSMGLRAPPPPLSRSLFSEALGNSRQASSRI